MKKIDAVLAARMRALLDDWEILLRNKAKYDENTEPLTWDIVRESYYQIRNEWLVVDLIELHNETNENETTCP